MSSGSLKRRIVRYLAQEISKGRRFFKSKEIARGVGSTSRQVANLLVILRQGSAFHIQEQAHSQSSTTWRIEFKVSPRQVYVTERALAPMLQPFRAGARLGLPRKRGTAKNRF
ncbi:MAG: hypothetical protein HY558_04420 [Euryarchaeota archaeon]|nr:hypothetical protein [Euryarchaeota archaeon]